MPKTYLKERGIRDQEIEKYGLGWFGKEDWPPFVDEGESDDGDRYREWSARGAKLKEKLFFPLHNAAGALRGFILRSIDDEQRGYQRFRIERSKVDGVFFGVKQALPSIWKKDRVFIVEGPFDQMAFGRLYPETVSVATAKVNDRQLEFLRRFVTEVNVAFDMDHQGRKASDRFIEEKSSQFETVRRIQYGAEDPSEALQKKGEEALKETVETEINPLGLDPESF